MLADKLHEKTAEREGHSRYFSPPRDPPIVAHEIDGGPELALYLGGAQCTAAAMASHARIGRPTLTNETGELLPSPS